MNIGKTILNAVTGGSSKDASKAAQAAVDAFGNLKAPTAEQLTLPELEKYVQAGILTPEQAQAYLVGHNALDSTSANNAGLDEEMKTISGLQNIVDQGGQDAMERSDVQNVINTLNTTERGANEAALRGAAARGTANSGTTLAAMLNNNSQAATNANQNGLNAAANAEARQLQALSAAGTTGGAVQGQIYGADVNKANAANAIAQFNAGTQNNNSQFNATTKNQAQASNLQNAQDIANKNTASKQVQQSSASTAQQQAYEDALARASGMAGAYTNQAKNDTTQGQQIGGIYGSVLGSIAKAGAGAPPAPTSGTPPASMATGGEVQAPMSMDCGGAVPGEPQVPGRDTEKNDTVPAMLSPHEVVIPASIAEKRDPREVMQFMRSLPRPERGIHPRAIMDTLKALDQIHTAAVRG